MLVQSVDLRVEGFWSLLRHHALASACLLMFSPCTLLADEGDRGVGDRSSESRISRDGARVGEGPRDGDGIKRGPRDRDRPRVGDKPRVADRRVDSREKSDRAPANRMGVTKFFGLMDKDRNGRLSQREIDMAVAVLRSLDRDRDGEVSQQEFGQPGVQLGREGESTRRRISGATDRPAMTPESMIRLADKDANGSISREEAPDRIKPFFDRIDANGDGALGSEEIAKMRSRLTDLRGNGLRDRPREGAGNGPRAREEAGGRTPRRPEL